MGVHRPAFKPYSHALLLLLSLCVVWAACTKPAPTSEFAETARSANSVAGPSELAAAPTQEEERFRTARARLVEHTKRSGVRDPRVLAALAKVPRHRFVPPSQVRYAYEDRALEIGEGQTISQPSLVAFMTELLEVGEEDKVLEIGTGSGYQAAILGELVDEVYTIEIVESLGLGAEKLLGQLGYDNIHVRIGDGYLGWEEHAPYDAIIVTCAPDHVPQPLVDQLKIGGRMCIPVGPAWQNQDLYLLIKKADGELVQQKVLPVVFVPLTGEHGVNR